MTRTVPFCCVPVFDTFTVRGIRYQRVQDGKVSDGSHRNVRRLDDKLLWWLPDDYPVEIAS